MREIKFRIWYPKSKKMVLWSEVIGLHISTIFQKDSEFQKLMQYTGLKDKNGAEIYEGDLIKFEGLAVLEVKFIYEEDEGRFGWNFGRTDCEVIGNIYENPELVKE